MRTDPSGTLTTLTRLGFAARGLLYLVIGFLVLRTGRTEDPAGALAVVAEGGGRTLLYLIVAGLLGYGLWRLSDAAFNIERHEQGSKGLRERIGAAASGISHLFLAWQAVRLLRGTGGSGSGGTQEGAQTALQLPGGQLMVAVAGLVLLAVGLIQFKKAWNAEFLKHLEPGIASQPWARWTGQGGYAARGLVFLISGGFLFAAGFKEQSSEAGGMAEALAWLSPPWDAVVAIGFIMFGLYSLIEARFRVLNDVPVEGLARQARSKLPV
ncbi:DUF1206 domain-containing protein [Sphingomonas sp. LHG3406-1]|uniref:DUF1206 domain-containing protein n=1 Tax=Sphingomonas sp. LHG3406-1 TaxID=2804617 RepID=UPI002630DE96|nr:DUF1206 domain-containing protein [Sphingomonas sp. LHG3406-1]